MDGPNPPRHTDGTFGLLPKVFIVYPHNPDVYTWTPDRELQEQQSRRTQEAVQRHNELVTCFAQFLESHKIAVAYEGLLTDTFTSNYMKWFQAQIADSDYVILIITNSFRHFLSSQPPEEKERIFTGQFLHIFVNNPSKAILPVFLNRRREPELLPDALKGSTNYEIMATRDPPYFDVRHSELDRLYALLTGQNRMRPPSPVARIPIIGNSIGGRASNSPSQFSDQHQRMYDSLSRIHRPISDQEIYNLSEKPGFASHWRMLAGYFKFTPPEIERIVGPFDRGDSENCITFLYMWKQKEPSNATISRLIHGLYSTRGTRPLEIANNVILQ